MKILITGATGFVGKHLMRRFVKSHEIHALVRPSTDKALLSVEKLFVFDDNIEELAKYMRSNEIDGIIHLASLYVSEHKDNQIKELILSNIYLGTAILEAGKRAGVKWLLNTGTIWQNYQSPDYKDIYNPVNLYAASKQAFMIMAKYYTETSNIRFCTLKLCDTYGEDDTRKKIYALFGQIAKSREILDMSPGEQLLDIVHVDKVIDAYEHLVEMLNDPKVEIAAEYVVTSGRHIRLRDLAVEYEQKHHVKLHVNWGGREYRKREVMKPYIGIPIPK